MPDILILDSGDIVDALETGTDFLTTMVVDNIVNQVTTDLYSPTFGTDLTLLPRYNIDSKSELIMKFMLAIEHVQAKIKEEQNETPSTPDEMLARVVLVDIYEDVLSTGSRWTLKLRVFSEAGDVKDFETNINKILKLN